MTTKHVRVWSEMRQNNFNGWTLEHIKRAGYLRGPQGLCLSQMKMKINKYRAVIS